jgi:hypothetical protein
VAVNVSMLCLSCNVKKVGKLVRFKQKAQKQASFLAFHKCCQGCLLRGPRYIGSHTPQSLLNTLIWLNNSVQFEHQTLRLLHIFYYKISHISAIASSHFKIIDNYLYHRNKHHSSPFINVVKGVFFVVRVTLVPVSYLSVPSTVHSYRVPGKFIRRLKSL